MNDDLQAARKAKSAHVGGLPRGRLVADLLAAGPDQCTLSWRRTIGLPAGSVTVAIDIDAAQVTPADRATLRDLLAVLDALAGGAG